MHFMKYRSFLALKTEKQLFSAWGELGTSVSYIYIYITLPSDSEPIEALVDVAAFSIYHSYFLCLS